MASTLLDILKNLKAWAFDRDDWHFFLPFPCSPPALFSFDIFALLSCALFVLLSCFFLLLFLNWLGVAGSQMTYIFNKLSTSFIATPSHENSLDDLM